MKKRTHQNVNFTPADLTGKPDSNPGLPPEERSDEHGNCATPKIETGDALPLPSPPPEEKRANESLREFHLGPPVQAQFSFEGSHILSRRPTRLSLSILERAKIANTEPGDDSTGHNDPCIAKKEDK